MGERSTNGPGQPKYRLLHDALTALIRDLPAGSGMPTERELCERFGVSRGTVRQALDHLEAEQRILRHQGRGTFVAGPKMDHLLELTSHTAYFRARGMEPGSRLISVTRVPATTEVARMLALAEGEEILQIERVRLADDEPLAIEVLHLGEAFRRGGRRARGVAIALRAVAARYGVELAWAEETIEAALSPEREAGLLGIPVGAPVLVLCRQSFDAIGRPVEFVRSYYRADRFRFRSRLQPPLATSGRVLPADTRLRLASVADAPGLAKVFVSAWRDGYVGIVDQTVLDALDEADIADWLRTLTSSNGPTTWAVESGEGEILAFSRHGEDPSDSRRGHIYSLYVAPHARGRGIAKALLDHDLQLLSERGPRYRHALGLRAKPGGPQPVCVIRLCARRRPQS